MTSKDVTPYDPERGHNRGSWFAVVIVLAIVGAIVVIPALAQIVFGIIGAIFALVVGLIGAAFAVVGALIASVFALGAVAVALFLVALPILILVAIGILIGRGTHSA